MPDRFANGDTTNDRTAKSPALINRAEGRYYHGGDIAGVRQKLPYLQSLGITAVWLTPIYDNNDTINDVERYDGKPVTDYHGYGATDFYGVDEHLGTLAEYKAMVDDAHTLGIKVIMDMVANHTGPYHPWVKDSPTPTWFHGTKSAHPDNTWDRWTIADPYGNAATRASTLDGWFAGFLPDLNQDDPEVARYIIQNTLWWAGMTGIDGIRQDTWQYVPRSFWKPWMAAIKREYPAMRVVGEVFPGDEPSLAFHFDGSAHSDGLKVKLDYLFDSPIFFAAREAFARGGSLKEVATVLSRDHIYPDASRLMSFIDSHDVERFMHEKGATIAGLMLANTFLFTTRGTPLLYYGDEIAMPGGPDPDNRRDFPGGWRGDTRDAFTEAGRTPEQQSVWLHTQRLLRVRASRPDLRRAPLENLLIGNQLYVYTRGNTLVALNNDTVAAIARIPIGELDGDLMGTCGPARADGRTVVVMIPKRSGCIFPIKSVAVPGPKLGVMGDIRHHPEFGSAFVAPRNVDVWLPPGYDANRAERYPVLYMHDGQNIFDPATSYGGVDWGIDETMTRLIAERKIRSAIVVGIWNSPKRYQEYMPQKALDPAAAKFSTGLGRPMADGEIISDAYLKFLVTELKPFIDRTYRTLRGRADTFVMGSSMGGLISLYAVSEYPNVFGGAACVSTHWPAGDGAVIDYLRRSVPVPQSHRIYFDHGTATLDSSYAPLQERADSVMRAAGYVRGKSFESRVIPGADHSERAWRQRVALPLEFLLGRTHD
jgi:glycosidase/predicted alpha/beta superfamily hydrolase